MIAAIILAAGQSKRMGQNKMLLPFGRSTVIETIVSEVAASQIDQIVVVTGHEREKIEALLAASSARCVFNPEFARSEMIVSIQMGLRALPPKIIDAALIVLGDQPRIQSTIVRQMIADRGSGALVIPSYRYQRGHPVLIDRSLWAEVMKLPPASTLRDFIRSHVNEICYVDVDSDSVIRDIDTPEDYRAI